MAHYALLDNNNMVTMVITGIDENVVKNGISDWEDYYGKLFKKKCVRTSYNGNIRGKYAGIGDIYNVELDVFESPVVEELVNE